MIGHAKMAILPAKASTAANELYVVEPVKRPTRIESTAASSGEPHKIPCLVCRASESRSRAKARTFKVVSPQSSPTSFWHHLEALINPIGHGLYATDPNLAETILGDPGQSFPHPLKPLL
jgi:hypothetical protein